MCGSNNKGQLGLGHRRDLTKLVQIPDLPAMEHVACGWDHTLGITRKLYEVCMFGCINNVYNQSNWKVLNQV